jgi:hypothetical protein
MCGVIPGDIDDLTGREVQFHIGKIRTKKLGGNDEPSNLQTLCSTCFQGANELRKHRAMQKAEISRRVLDQVRT